MKHARPDYDRFQDPEGKIPADEPVFLLRGQDVCAAETVRAYAGMVERAGGSAEMVSLCRSWADQMEQWPKKKTPDLPPRPAPRMGLYDRVLYENGGDPRQVITPTVADKVLRDLFDIIERLHEKVEKLASSGWVECGNSLCPDDLVAGEEIAWEGRRGVIRAATAGGYIAVKGGAEWPVELRKITAYRRAAPAPGWLHGTDA